MNERLVDIRGVRRSRGHQPSPPDLYSDGVAATETHGPPVDTLGTLPGGDFIIAVDGRPVSEPDDLIAFLVFDAVVGQTISLTVIRDGEQIEVPLTLGERP